MYKMFTASAFVFLAVMFLAVNCVAAEVTTAEVTATKVTTADPTAAFASPVLSEQEKLFFELINAHRKSEGLEPLTPCPNLMFGARRWATKHGYGHASGGFNGECLAPSGDAESAFSTWLGSDGHRRIMLRSEYRYGGIGFDRNRAVLRVSREPFPYRDASSTGKRAYSHRSLKSYLRLGFRR
jgi:uncharacterized protein YkwD